MRVSFDLDEVLFVSPDTHKTEEPLPFPFNKFFKERLRLGAPELISRLREMGYEVWIYTSSFRSERYIRTLFYCYGVHLDGIVNGERHLREVQRGRRESLPQKLPNRYKISLHIDDEAIILTNAQQYGYNVYQLDAQDDEWKDKIIARAEQIKLHEAGGKEEQTPARSANAGLLTKTMFRLLPIQILLAAVGAVTGIISSLFASNYVGVNAMSAIGLYGPLSMLIQAVSTMLVGGAVILCGKYIGQNNQEKMKQVFTMDMVASAFVSLLFVAVFLILSLLDLTGFFTKDPEVRPLFNRYLLGQAIGVFPLVMGGHLAAFLSIENKGSRTTVASLAYIAVSILLHFLFVKVMRLEAFGLALASSFGLWVFFGVQAAYFISGKSHIRLIRGRLPWKEIPEILRIGLPGALGSGYQTIRGLAVNRLVEVFVGTVGISAFAAANNLLSLFWAIPTGMLAVSRMMISVSIGEEDRKTLADVMRVMLKRFVPLMFAVSLILICCAVPLTRLFFRDPSEPVYQMTIQGLRILPLCMPLAIICAHYICYGQASGKQGLVHVLSVMDGVVFVTGFTALLIRSLGVSGVYLANVLNGAGCILLIVAYSIIMRKRFPRTMEDLMVIPEKFGVPAKDRLDLTIRSMEEVVQIAEKVQHFCLEKGSDKRRAYLAGLSMEEMAGNIVSYGFTADKKRHSIDVRVSYQADELILRLKDDCVPFDPGEFQQLADNEDITRNIGIRMVFRISKDVQYQNILGMNVLTIKI